MSPAILTLVILVISCALFVTELLPMGVTAFITALTLYFTGIIDATTLFSKLADSNVILIVAMCVVGEAFFQTGMAYKTGKLISKFAKTERALIVGIMLIGGIMSGFLSNTGTVAVLMPIACGIAQSRNIKPIKLLIPLTAAATIGADISLAGSPGNMVAKSTIEEMSGGTMTVSFLEYSKIGIPLLAVSILTMALFGHKLIPDREPGESLEAKDYSDVPAWKGKVALGVLLGAIVLMVLTDYISWLPKIHIIASVAALLLVVTGVLTQKQAFDSFEMQIVFLLAFMTPLGNALDNTGAGALIADTIVKVTGNSGSFALLAAMWLLTWALTQFMSNTAACTLLCPIAWSVAQSMGADPRAVVIAVFIGSSVAVCTPLAIPANAMIMGPAGAKFKDFIKTGLLISLVCFIVSMILLPIFYPFYPAG